MNNNQPYDVVFEVDNNKAYIRHINENAIYKILSLISRATRFENPEADYLIKSGYQCARYIKLFNERYMHFPVGLTNLVSTILMENNFHKIKIIDNRPKINYNQQKLQRFFDMVPFSLRPYQMEAVNAAIESSIGGFSMATGSGKSLIFLSMVNAFDFERILIIVNLASLAEQHYKLFKDVLGEDQVGMVGAQNNDTSKPITIAVINSLYNSVTGDSKKQFTKWLKEVDCLVLDEYHHSASMMYRKVLRKCSNAKRKWGLSATAFRKYDDDLYMESFVGDVVYRMDTSTLIEQGWLAKANIIIDDMGEDCPKVRRGAWAKVYKKAIVEYDLLLSKTADWVKFFYERGLKTIVFVDHLPHGEKLKSVSIGHHICHERHIEFVHGRMPLSQRNENFDRFRNGDLQVLALTSLGNEGLDFPEGDVGINACGGDSPVVATQRLGRILRKRKQQGEIDIDPNRHQKVYYVDFIHRQNIWLHTHSINRINIYNQERAIPIYVKRETAA